MATRKKRTRKRSVRKGAKPVAKASPVLLLRISPVDQKLRTAIYRLLSPMLREMFYCRFAWGAIDEREPETTVFRFDEVRDMQLAKAEVLDRLARKLARRKVEFVEQ